MSAPAYYIMPPLVSSLVPSARRQSDMAVVNELAG